MLQAFTSHLSTRIAWRTLQAMIALALLASCSKKDHEPKPVECTLLSRESVQEGTNSSTSSKNVSSTEVNLNDQNQLVSGTNTYTSELRVTQSALIRKTTDKTEFNLTYDSNGFLIRMVRRYLFLFEGYTASFLFGNSTFTNFRREDVEIWDYKYQSGHIASSTKHTSSTFLGNNQSLPGAESTESKVYQYDSNGMPLTATTTKSNGSTLTTFKNGVINSVVEKNLGGAVVRESKYNAMGLLSSSTDPQGVFESTYDSRGNLTSVQEIVNGQKTYINEYFYDDYKNPETDIPQRFKGIPERIMTVQLTDGVNNITREKTTLFSNNQVSETKTTYEYNASGFPVSSLHIRSSGEIIDKTAFNYKCQ